jgi:hypothetical protein
MPSILDPAFLIPQKPTKITKEIGKTFRVTSLSFPTGTSKLEIRNPKQIQSTNRKRSKRTITTVWNFPLVWKFEFISDFGFRISDFYLTPHASPLCLTPIRQPQKTQA